ncbi:MAG TPA: ATP-binding protein [Bryobacteraceae bacterium]|nr:ATP-binding protein [Bryobacteraceae bacterium]
MRQPSNPDENNRLRARNSELEEQLAAAGREAEVQDEVETALRATLLYLENVVDTVREPMLVLDRALRVRTASRAFYQTFGVSKEETERQLIHNLGDGQWDIPALRTLLEEVLLTDKSFRDFEVVHNFPTLGRRVMMLNARKLWREGNHSELILLAIEDVTERKRLADELIRSNEDMQRFAYVAAHDLRSPLHSALKLCKLAARRLEGTGGEEAHLVSMSIESLERLRRLMEDILSYSEVANAPQQRTLVALEEPLRIALLNLDHHIRESAAEVTFGPLPEVPADRTQMVMVFQNLVANAIKYRRKGEVPRIRIEGVREDAFWKMSVSDNGEGFEPAYAGNIFEPFKRLHGKDVPGSGIGLATCKRVIERLGGRIWPESVRGQGSTFYFTLPA